jgi:hypothetical protein
MYTHVTVEVAYGRFEKFFQVMPRVKAIVERAGWTLKEALVQQNGQLFTVIHIWILRDMNHYAEGVAALNAHPDFPELTDQLASVVNKETIVFAVDAPYAPSRQSWR